MNEMAPIDDGETRVSIRLSPSVKRAVEEIMRLGAYTSLEAAVKRAISDELFLQKQRNEGATIMIKKGQDFQELIWHD